MNPSVAIENGSPEEIEMDNMDAKLGAELNELNKMVE
jgi:hypothetical protein